jgi:hypothetical protein
MKTGEGDSIVRLFPWPYGKHFLVKEKFFWQTKGSLDVMIENV